MKRFVIALIISVCGSVAYGQSVSKAPLEKSISTLESAKTANDFAMSFDEFSKLSKTTSEGKWMAYYYAAYAKYREIEMVINQKSYKDLNDMNWLAYKYATTSADQQKDNSDAQKLVQLIMDQQQKIQKLQ